MKFSLVLATVNRTQEVARLLVSLYEQTYRDFELIVVDQNDDDRLIPLLSLYDKHFSILHLRSERGLSKARNVGLKHITGDLIAFPDDDCWYPRDLLRYTHDQLQAHPSWNGMTGRSIDERGRESAFRFGQSDALINRISVWNQAISYTLFLRREVVDKVGCFDENLGVGAGTLFGSGEETDYLIRALDAGFKIYYSPELAVHHPHPESILDKKVCQRAYAYGCGMGRVLTKHDYPVWFKIRTVVRPLGGALLSFSMLAIPKASLHWHRCIGRLRGMRG